MAAKIRRNDEVIVLTGKDKGKRGKVTNVLSSGKVIVDGINLVKKHQKPAPNQSQPGGIIEKEAAIQVSNVALVNTETGKADRVGFRFEEGKKVRFFKSNGETVPSEKISK
ncbi:50S ribosomal protein L24 [Candidatus Fukatsuia symbiotica]|uniref:Large ribosomal subunit protein uL24 n=1 Tax=Candidatus Fukatsuia symbiotica TaxID=1878942 RepID=A0A2U8I6Z2_9GAMM|nr:50S ribosomal protein L24 [Candidatus Fukatsuia symbiotica]AWK14867.1 50S ribosomal protein L24 [Candidatus Fukatsuia symbiotica]MEA9445211.1 50S ribosomal protein L24 [Candidatus Fukatsuia symbiotica]